MKVGEWVTRAETALARKGIASPRLEAQLLLARARQESRSQLLAALPAPLTDETVKTADRLLAERLADKPMAYILGEREFFGRSFAVGPGVLVPRIETETLIEAALELPWASALDVGTGTGCIAWTLAAERPGARVVALEVSEEAMAYAERNRAALAPRGELRRSDGLAAVAGETFDLIISNPPYIGRSEPLPAEVRDWEPEMALFAEENGLAFYRRLACEAADHLTFAGHLIVELGDGRGTEVSELFRAEGWTVVSVEHDLDNRPRALVLTHGTRRKA